MTVEVMREPYQGEKWKELNMILVFVLASSSIPTYTGADGKIYSVTLIFNNTAYINTTVSGGVYKHI